MRVGNDLDSTSIVAGVAPGVDLEFGTGDDVAPGSATLGRIASINVSGIITGTPAGGDSFGFMADSGTFVVSATGVSITAGPVPQVIAGDVTVQVI